MANDLNLCQFIGRLGNDPEIRYLPNGDAVANISIAVGSKWKNKQTGEAQESVEWVRCTAFRQLAEIIKQYLTKGSRIYASGRMKTRKYQAQDGSDRYSTEIVLENMQMLDGKQDGDQRPAQQPQRQQPQRMDPQNRASMGAQAPAQSNWEDDGDSIPF